MPDTSNNDQLLLIKQLIQNEFKKNQQVQKPMGDGSSSMVRKKVDEVLIVDERGDSKRFFALLDSMDDNNQGNRLIQERAIKNQHQNKTQLDITNAESKRQLDESMKSEKAKALRDEKSFTYSKETRNVFNRMVSFQKDGTGAILSLPKALGGKIIDSTKRFLREDTLVGKIGQAFGLWSGEARLAAESEAENDLKSFKQQEEIKENLSSLSVAMKDMHKHATKKGSLYTHDIYTELLLEQLVGRFTPAEREKSAIQQGSVLGKLLKEGSERNDFFQKISDPRNNKSLKISSKGFDRLAQKMTDLRMENPNAKSKGGLLSTIMSMIPLVIGALGFGASVSGFGNLFKGVTKWLPKLGQVTGITSKIGGYLKKATGIGKITGAVGKVGTKVLGKTGGKFLSKTLGKKIPGVGLAIAGGLAAGRFATGDTIGGVAELASGIASLVPLYGTAVSIAIDAGLALRDNWDSITGFFEKTFTNLPEFGKKMFSSAKEAGSKILAGAMGIGSTIKDSASGLVGKISNWWSDSDMTSKIENVSKQGIEAGKVAGNFLLDKGEKTLALGITASKMAASQGKKALALGVSASALVASKGKGLLSAGADTALNVAGSAKDVLKSGASSIGGLFAGLDSNKMIQSAASFVPMTTRQQTDVLVTEIRMLRTTIEEMISSSIKETEANAGLATSALLSATLNRGPMQQPSTVFSAPPVGIPQAQMVIKT